MTAYQGPFKAVGSEAVIKSQFKKADKSGARVALILGEEEVAEGKVGIKFLREDKPQETIQISDLAEYLESTIGF